MENKKNEKWEHGFSATEFLTVIVVATILLAIVLTMVLDVAQTEKYKVMKYDATLLGYNASSSSVYQNRDKYYLQQLIDDQLFINIKNPFYGEKYCDAYRSFVEMTDGKKYVTLKCGAYLIEHQDITQDEFVIYKVSSWQLKKINSDKAEQQTLYNYRIKGKEVLSEPYPEDTFLLLLNQAYQSSYEKVSEIPKAFDIVKNTYYRIKTIVYEK